jgi:hypothetical protein
MWGYVTVPFLPGNGAPASYLGSNWSGSGPAWVVGPVVSLWGPRVGIHIGAHAAERLLLGGLWVMVHATVEGRITDGVRAIVQGVVLGEVVNEAPNAAALPLGGHNQSRVFPYAIVGLRLHSRRFSVDFGLLATMLSNEPLSTGGVSVWPWTSVSQTF